MERGWPELGDVIRNERKSKKLTQEQLAELANTHWTYVSEIENGHRNPGVAVLRRIADGLGIRLSALIAEAEVTSNQDP